MNIINFIIAWLNKTWVNSIIGIIGGVITLMGIVVGIPSIISYLSKTQVNFVSFDTEHIIGIVILVVAVVILSIIKFLKKPISNNTSLFKKPTSGKTSLPKTDNFQSQLGHADTAPNMIINYTFIISNFLQKIFEFIRTKSDMLEKSQGKNPFIADGCPLAANSAMFYGRKEMLERIESILLRPENENSGCVSLVGEDKMGKTSLLNNIYQHLSTKEQTISVYTAMSDWQFNSQPDFFAHLHRAICQALPIKNVKIICDYEELRDFIRNYAEKGYHFVLLIDEFDKMLKHPCFDNEFFEHMRALGNNPKYHFSFVLVSRNTLEEICTKNKTLGSKFWGIFKEEKVGLLDEKSAENLITKSMKATLSSSPADLHAVTKEILNLAGRHPLLIQIVASAYWEAFQNGQSVIDVDKETLKYQDLYPHFRALWKHRTEEEQQILRKIAVGELVTRNKIVADLEQRNLLTKDDQLFSPSFKSFIQEN